MENVNKRASTRKRIQNALVSLYARKPYDQITVSEVCTEAGIYRATFYRYYNHLGEVLDALEDAILGDLGRIGEEFLKFRPQIILKNPRYLKERYKDICRYMYDHRQTVLVLLSPGANPSFKIKFKRDIYAVCAEILRMGRIEFTERTDILIHQQIVGLLEALYIWLDRGTLSTDRMAELLCALNASTLQLIQS